MDDNQFKAIAQQLRKPSGEFAFQIGEKMNVGNLHINLHTIAALNLHPKERVLEVGLGNGFFIKDVLSSAKGIHYTGCDFSSEMIHEARMLNAEYLKNGSVTLSESNVEKMPFSAQSFDKAFTINTLYFWEDSAKVLSEFHRVLKPEGNLLISIRPKHQMETYPFSKHGFNLYTKNEVIVMLESNGFQVQDIIEKEEPNQKVGGTEIKVASLIICSQKV